MTITNLCRHWINILRTRPYDRHLAGGISKLFWCFKVIIYFFTQSSLKLVPKGPIYNIAASFYVMDWRRSCNEPLSGPMTA